MAGIGADQWVPHYQSESWQWEYHLTSVEVSKFLSNLEILLWPSVWGLTMRRPLSPPTVGPSQYDTDWLLSRRDGVWSMRSWLYRVEDYLQERRRVIEWSGSEVCVNILHCSPHRYRWPLSARVVQDINLCWTEYQAGTVPHPRPEQVNGVEICRRMLSADHLAGNDGR